MFFGPCRRGLGWAERESDDEGLNLDGGSGQASSTGLESPA